MSHIPVRPPPQATYLSSRERPSPELSTRRTNLQLVTFVPLESSYGYPAWVVTLTVVLNYIVADFYFFIPEKPRHTAG